MRSNWLLETRPLGALRREVKSQYCSRNAWVALVDSRERNEGAKRNGHDWMSILCKATIDYAQLEGPECIPFTMAIRNGLKRTAWITPSSSGVVQASDNRKGDHIVGLIIPKDIMLSLLPQFLVIEGRWWWLTSPLDTRGLEVLQQLAIVEGHQEAQLAWICADS